MQQKLSLDEQFEDPFDLSNLMAMETTFGSTPAQKLQTPTKKGLTNLQKDILKNKVSIIYEDNSEENSARSDHI